MKKRRNFFHFLLIRFGALYSVVFLFGFLPDQSIIDAATLCVPLVLLTAIYSFLEFDSLPIALLSKSGIELIDPSGKAIAVDNYSTKQFLWLHRLIYIHEGSVKTVPSEAYVRGFSGLL